MTIKILPVFFLLSSLGCFRLCAQTAYELRFSADKVEYQGLLLNSPSAGWALRIRYFDQNKGCERLIEQKIRVTKNHLGLRLAGYSVWDVRLRCCPVDYAADQFYLYEDQSGHLYSTNLDEYGTTSTLRIEPVAAGQQAAKLHEFSWN
ncbi:MAG: hypothetical protein ABIQ93_11490 [Saprospiraceae bacterium]